MKRRRFLTASAAAAAIGPQLARPALAQGTARVLRFAPQGNLANPDPVWTTTTIARNHALMVWDCLYGWDEKLAVQPQMAAGHTVSDDKLVWTITLRDGLRFHDGEPVRATDWRGLHRALGKAPRPWAADDGAGGGHARPG